MIKGLETGRGVALLINECQRGLLEPEHSVIPAICSQAAARGIVPRIAALAEAFRATGHPVVHIHVAHRADLAGVSVNNPAVASIVKRGGMLEGSAQVEPVPQLLPLAQDHVVRRYSGMTVFYGNHLDSLLRNLDVKTVVPSGVSSNVAVPGMILGALDRGYRVVLPEDCIAGTSAEIHDFLLEHMFRPLATVSNSEAIITTLRAGR